MRFRTADPVDQVDPAAPAEGPWTVTIPGWNPPTLNALLRAHWRRRARLKKAAINRVADECRYAGVPTATGRRGVLITVVVANRGHLPDPDGVLKCLLDGLVHVGALVDDSAEWLDCPTPTVLVGRDRATVITLGDLPAEAPAADPPPRAASSAHRRGTDNGTGRGHAGPDPRGPAEE